MLPAAPPPTHCADPAADAAMLLSTLTLATGFVQDGRAVDLAGLEDDVAQLCAAVLALPAEQGRALRADLLRLAVAADMLQDALLAEPTA